MTEDEFGKTHEALLKGMHASLTVRWGTEAPFSIGHVRAERVGYADIPGVVVTVFCRDEDLSALVPITRQRVYAELAERGWTPDDIEFQPSVQRNRRRKFRDENESSESYGLNKYGREHRFLFEMRRELAKATFVGSGSFRELPNREDRE